MRFLVPIVYLVLAFFLPANLEQRQGASLKGDSRVGKVTDRQGSALVRPVGSQRWTPLSQKSLLFPGDLVRTLGRGANAIEIELKGGGALVLGPGSMLEIEGPGRLRLYSGEIEVVGSAKQVIEISGPGGFSKKLNGKSVLRAKAGRTEALALDPRWLTGYKNSTTDEWMGSLIAKVDGRDVPLTVGYHKVSVEINDQIARTTIEQSFKNSTAHTLEGKFVFPLPADASISSFGMWIGNELVEADLVEKQRARAIYEELLRKKKDPGLLEWSGGNLFKARVYPIRPHSEKRIRIRYTQVLPLNGSSYRYSYALKSDLLSRHPLRELQLTVKIASTMPILEISSATHEVRLRKTKHSASAEFLAQEFSPDKDFELEVKIDRTASLAVVPHRRGDDGYFMLLLSPPGTGGGAWTRELMPESDPIQLCIIADTSASMDDAARESQESFILAMLALLGPKDSFRLMTADIDARWFNKSALPVEQENIDTALAFLRERFSLGWSDLDRAFETALRATPEGCTIVYIGDGIGTTGNGDPVALADRLTRIDPSGKRTCHAITTSSSYEKGVMDAIGSIGGGSVRPIGQDPVQTAFRVLSEATQSLIKDLEINFEGLEVAAVYPRRLPNLPGSSQQIVLGRYLAGGKAQSGRVVVTGKKDGKRVSYRADFALPTSEDGNSFIPRLWARLHLDQLLAEGRSNSIKEDIVGFSQEFGIITPYTSFLVLDSDEDREKYGVQRRVKMRDGEKFFAKGKDQADKELLRQQMNIARSWRLRLRARMLAEIKSLGRNLAHSWNIAIGTTTSMPYPISGAVGGSYIRDSDVKLRSSLGIQGPRGRFKNDSSWALPAEMSGKVSRLEESKSSRKFAGGKRGALSPAERNIEADDDAIEFDEEESGDFENLAKRRNKSKDLLESAEGFVSIPKATYAVPDSIPFGLTSLREGIQTYGQVELFPGLRPAKRRALHIPAPLWSSEVKSILKDLNRRTSLGLLNGGLAIEVAGGSVHVTRGHFLMHESYSALVSSKEWFTRQSAWNSQPVDSWLAGQTRGILALGYLLGRKRDAVPADWKDFSFPMSDSSLTEFERSFERYDIKIASRDGSLVTLAFRAPGSTHVSTHYVVDISRKVIVKRVDLDSAGKPTGTLRLTDFSEAAGSFWAGKAVYTDVKGRATRRHSMKVTALTAAEFAKQLAVRLTGQDDAIFLPQANVKLDKAKQAVLDGSAGFAEHYRMTRHFSATERWPEAWRAWGRAQQLVSGKSGASWLRLKLLEISRKGEELEDYLKTLIPTISASRDIASVFRADQIFQIARSKLGNNETLEVLEALHPVYLASGDETQRLELAWQRKMAQTLFNLGRRKDGVEIRASLAAKHPSDQQAQMDHINDLSAAGENDMAIAWAKQALGVANSSAEEIDSAYARLTALQWDTRRLEDLLQSLQTWMALKSETELPYQRYLATLVHMDRVADADAWALKSLENKGSFDDRSLRAQVAASANYALGNSWNLHVRYVPEKLRKPLTDIALAAATSDANQCFLTQRIYGDWRFRQTEEYRALKKGLYEQLSRSGSIAELPLQKLVSYVNLLDWHKNGVDEEIWKSVSTGLRKRWDAAKDTNDVLVLGDRLLWLMDRHNEREGAVSFQRLRLARAGPFQKSQIAEDLMGRLSRLDWTAEIERELFELLPQLMFENDLDSNKRRLAAQQIRRLSKTLYRMRYAASMGKDKDNEKLERNALREKKKATLRSTRAKMATLLEEASKNANAWSRAWFKVESLSYAVQGAQDLGRSERLAKTLLAGIDSDENAPELRLLRERAALVLAYAAVHRKSPEGLADRILEIYDSEDKEHGKLLDWKYQSIRLLIALDRVEQLERTLAAWIAPGKAESRWRILLGYLLAERGKLAAAVQAFEAVATIDELSWKDYEALANWQLILEDETRRKKALADKYRAMPESQLRSRVRAISNKVRRRGNKIPEELSAEDFMVMKFLLRKSSNPQYQLWYIWSTYQQTKDFRVLASIVEGSLGHSPDKLYQILRNLSGYMKQVHEEATCDSLLERILELRKNDLTATDLRALDLVEALVRRRAAAVLNQPGQQEELGLLALKRGFERNWQAGERYEMARFLKGLGKIQLGSHRNEQLRQLRLLHEGMERGSWKRLKTGAARARTIAAYQRYRQAIVVMGAALADYRSAHGGQIDNSSIGEVRTLITWFEKQGRFRAAESYLVEALAQQSSPGQTANLRLRLYDCYVNCISKGGTLSLGSGKTLLENAGDKMLDKLWALGAKQVQNIMSRFNRLHVQAFKKAGIRDTGSLYLAFTKTELPKIMSRAPQRPNYLLRDVGNTLKQVVGPIAGITFLVEQIEGEPSWYERAGINGWSTYGWYLARWRRTAGRVGLIEDRLLAVVLEALERYLRGKGSGSNSIFYRSNRDFWHAKRSDYLRIAMKVLELEEDKPATILRSANYIWSGLGRRTKAAEAMINAEKRGKVHENGLDRLAGWLQSLKRYSESLPYIEKLLTSRKFNLSYRVMKFIALHRTGKKAEALAFLDASEKLLKTEKRWNEASLATLAKACLDAEFHDRSVLYYDELISLHQRTRARRGIGNSTLANYYRYLAQAQSALGQIDKAVDAASAAVIAWGANSTSRAKALRTLARVVGKAKDLDAFVAKHDKEVADTGLDAPLMRKIFGKVYLNKGEARKAVVQLLLARKLQPADEETHKHLLAAFDQQADTKGAVAALISSIKFSPRTLSLYENLGKRYQLQGDKDGAERAWTSMVEALPDEAQSHGKLAAIREGQERFKDAVVQWQQVTRIRSLEPDGWLSLASAQIKAGDKSQARSTLDTILKKSWHSRFGNVRSKAAKILSGLGSEPPK